MSPSDLPLPQRARMRLNDILLRDPAEECVAISVESDPDDLPQWWHWVQPFGKKLYEAQLVHELVPASQTYKRTKELEQRYGTVIAGGMTYDIGCLTMSYNRVSEKEKEELSWLYRKRFEKENFLKTIKFIAAYKDKEFRENRKDAFESHPVDFSSEGVYRFIGGVLSLVPNKLWQMIQNKAVANHEKIYRPCTREEALRKAKPFPQEDPTQAKNLIKKSIQEARMGMDLMRALSFD